MLKCVIRSEIVMKQIYSKICYSVEEMHVTSTTKADAGMRLLIASCLYRLKVHVGLQVSEFYN